MTLFVNLHEARAAIDAIRDAASRADAAGEPGRPMIAGSVPNLARAVTAAAMASRVLSEHLHALASNADVDLTRTTLADHLEPA